MDLAEFHQKLLGREPPERYQITDVQRALYTVFPEKRGYLIPQGRSARDHERFIATLVAAISMGALGPSYVVFRKSILKWGVDNVSDITKYLFGVRRSASHSAVRNLHNAIKNLHYGTSLMDVPRTTERWVAYGFKDQDEVPVWMRGKLFKV